jgi:hypothetical protein
MSTLCRAKRKWQKHGGAEKSAPKAFGVLPTHFSAFQKRVYGCRRISEKQSFSEKISDYFFGALKDVFGGTPDAARETHALPIHLPSRDERGAERQNYEG